MNELEIFQLIEGSKFDLIRKNIFDGQFGELEFLKNSYSEVLDENDLDIVKEIYLQIGKNIIDRYWSCMIDTAAREIHWKCSDPNVDLESHTFVYAHDDFHEAIIKNIYDSEGKDLLKTTRVYEEVVTNEND
jgi:hypothetical protein